MKGGVNNVVIEQTDLLLIRVFGLESELLLGLKCKSLFSLLSLEGSSQYLVYC